MAEDLEAVQAQLYRLLGISDAFVDEGVGQFGLRNIVMTIGDTFLEVVSPVQEQTTAGRLLERRGGDGGYMVIVQVDDLGQAKQRLAETDIRIVWEADVGKAQAIHLHPRDVPGALPSLDQMDPPGAWYWAGPGWQDRAARHALAITGAQVQVLDPVGAAERWSQAYGEPVRLRDGTPVLSLGDTEVRFVEIADERGEGLQGIDLRCDDTAAMLARAEGSRALGHWRCGYCLRYRVSLLRLRNAQMRWLKRIALALLVVLGVGLFLLVATGNGRLLEFAYGFAFGRPALPFDPADTVPAPDYADPANWAALPSRGGEEADMMPAGIPDGDIQGFAPVDVFFIHPTGFLKGSSWTYSMDPDTSSEENTRWMMANQASAYNGCCNVYAPRYRQASIYAYMSEDAVRDEVLAFAYQDVERAFDYYLEHYNQGRPFVIASHSQGTHHGVQLIRQKIDGTPLVDRLVAGYLIGGNVRHAQLDDIGQVGVCESEAELGCIVHWDTWSELALEDAQGEPTDNVCVNPLTWKLDGDLAGREHHLGAVPGSGEYHIDIVGDDAARGVEFGPLGQPVVNAVEARCANGMLYITDQSETRFGQAGTVGTNYHGLDYPIFHMDIRENAKLRVATYLARSRTADMPTPDSEESSTP